MDYFDVGASHAFEGEVNGEPSNSSQDFRDARRTLGKFLGSLSISLWKNLTRYIYLKIYGKYLQKSNIFMCWVIIVGISLTSLSNKYGVFVPGGSTNNRSIALLLQAKASEHPSKQTPNPGKDECRVA